MRIVLWLLVACNLAAPLLGLGWFGPRPVDEGREPRALSQRNQHLVTLQPPQATRLVKG